MNYLCVLGESIGHAGMLPAPLELGSRAGGSSWGQGKTPIESRGGQAVTEPWRESPP